MTEPKQPQSQREKFEQVARELETDDSEEHFRAIVKKIATPPRKPAADRPADKGKSSK